MQRPLVTSIAEPTEQISQSFVMMYAATTREPMDLLPFPVGLDVHWEREKRVTWNEREHVNEEEELVYEVSWICEIGVWRRFLRSRRKVQK